MKRIAYSMFLIALMSCGKHSQLGENRVQVFYKNLVSEQYDLLFVNDTALIVQSDRDYEPISIPFSMVDHVNINIHGKRTGGLFGLLIGSIGTAALGKV